jgi:fibronectin type 3 domain-containing protein
MMRLLVSSTLALVASGCAALPPDLSLGQLFAPEPVARVLSPGDASHLGAPEGLRASSGEYRIIPLKWDPVLSGDVAGYLVERSETREGPFEQLAIIEGRGHLGHIDGAGESLGDGETHFYRVRAFDTESRLSAEASEVVVGTTAHLPDPPSGILAYSRQPREIPLSWQAVEGLSVGGYRVERCPSPNGRFEVVAELKGRHSTSYVDVGLGDLRVFYYRVRTTNLGGAAGEPSDPVRAVTKPVPLPPVALHVGEQQLGVNVLRWEANVEEDLVEYRVFRVVPGEPSQLVAAVAVDELEARDPNVGSREDLLYAVRALDRDGLMSTEGLAIPVTGEGYESRISRTETGVLLEWNPRADEGYVDALVERRSWLEAGRVYRANSGSLLDEDVAPGRRYEYVITLERLDGSRAPSSRPVTIQLPEASD